MIPEVFQGLYIGKCFLSELLHQKEDVTMKKITCVVLALVLVLGLLAGCGAETTTTEPTTTDATTTEPTTEATTTAPVEETTARPNEERYGGEYIMSTSNVPSSLDPHYGDGSMGNYQWALHCFDTAIILGSDGTFYPNLCDYTLSEDGTVLTLTMKEGKFFSDGTPVTIEDVVASYERLAAVAPNSGFSKNFMAKLADTQVEGNTVTYTFEAPDTTILQRIGSLNLQVWVMPKAICEKYPDCEIDNIEDVIGSNCYKLVSYDDTFGVTMERNEYYVPDETMTGPGPAATRYAYADSITYALNGDAASRTAAMIAGEYTIGGITTEMQPYADQIGLKKMYTNALWTHAIFFNLGPNRTDSPVQDVNFRKAVRAALDMEEIMLAVTNNDPDRIVYDPAPIIKENTTYYTPAFEETEYNIHDLTKAKEYLDASSYNGETIKWLCSSGSAFYRAAVVGAQQLEAIGINVELYVVDSGSHNGIRSDVTADFDIGAWETQKATYNPVQQNNMILNTAGGWWTGRVDEETGVADEGFEWAAEWKDALARLKAAPTGSEESVAAYHEIADLTVENVPYIGFGWAITVTYCQPDFVSNYDGIVSYYWNSYTEQ